jgi:hypothetical protein
MGGLAKRLFGIFGAPEDRLLLDASLQLAPGYIQVMAAVMDRWLSQIVRRDPDAELPIVGGSRLALTNPIGGTPDSCYMWRSDGPMMKLRSDPSPEEE